MHCGYVTTLKNVRPHSNADRLLLADCFGNTICVSTDYSEGQIGIYFPADLQLSTEFCQNNNLLRLRDENGHSIPGGGYMDPDKRNVKAIKLRGEKSDGLFLPLHCLEPFGDITKLRVGDTIDVFNGHEICKKYIPRSDVRKGHYSEGNKTRKHKTPVAPLFMEHADTEQLAYNLDAFRCGDEIEITLKMHGTSQRTAYLPTLHGYKRSLWDRITRKEGTPIYNWGGVSGTRRVVLEDFDGGFYGSNAFREQHSKFFDGKLWKGETVYYEVVGFTDTGAPIMAECSNKKLNDPDFVKQYGDTTVFSYGCCAEGMTLKHGIDEDGAYSLQEVVPQSDVYIYRMTMTNEDGDVVEYTPDFMRYRCEQMGAKTVPVLWKGTIPEHPGSEEDPTITAGEWIKNVAERFYDGPDPIGKTHVREGVVVRILNRPKFCAYKHKNHSFKMISGIIAEAVADGTVEVNEEVLAEL